MVDGEHSAPAAVEMPHEHDLDDLVRAIETARPTPPDRLLKALQVGDPLSDFEAPRRGLRQEDAAGHPVKWLPGAIGTFEKQWHAAEWAHVVEVQLVPRAADLAQDDANRPRPADGGRQAPAAPTRRRRACSARHRCTAPFCIVEPCRHRMAGLRERPRRA
jgi:hypothetical protein